MSIQLSTKTLVNLARDELVQLFAEGRVVDELHPLYERAADTAANGNTARRAVEDFWAHAADAPMRGDYSYDEPSSWQDIAGDVALDEGALAVPDRDPLADRIHGAWLGRCAGCMLGKPVEGLTRTQIATLLEIAGEYPLDDYFPIIEDHGDIPYRNADDDCLLPNISYSARDDDTDYTVLGLHMVKTFGLELTPANVGFEWQMRLPYMKTYTAERAAYRNLVMDVPVAEAAVVLNPYREWIGAQIRCDAFGYVSPGKAWQAAYLAYQDAALSHVKNGIYGEVFFAALIAESLVCGFDDLEGAIERAMRVVPDKSRFAEMVREVAGWCDEDDTWEATWDRINRAYGHYHPVHTINNAALVLIGLLHSGGDFGRAICIAVMGGWDTDCNGATVGSVMGALLGAGGVDARWADPLNDTLHSAIDGYQISRISELAAQTTDLAAQL
jgi:ADP-ribosylglycohydrolase